MKDEVGVMGSPSLLVLMISVDVKLCERRGGRPGLPVPNSPHDICGRRVSLSQIVRTVFVDVNF